MTTYPFRQGIDYGPRKGTLGIVLHMSEGGDNLVSYLAKAPGETDAQWRTRIRGVSANACFLSDGAAWQMVNWANASGSLNPADRNPATTGYYNGTVIRAVLGPNYVDPNTWSISAEIAGRRADGPTDAQVRAVIAWGKEMAAQFPTLRGAYGHNDQTDTKGCPGTTANMKAIFDGLGGHGLWAIEAGGSDVRFANSNGYGTTSAKRLAVPANTAWTYLDGSPGGTFGKAATVDCLGLADSRSGQYVVEISTGSPYVDKVTRTTIVMVKTSAVPTDVPVAPPAPAPDTSPYTQAQLDAAVAGAKAAEHERTRAAAIAAVEAIA